MRHSSRIAVPVLALVMIAALAVAMLTGSAFAIPRGGPLRVVKVVSGLQRPVFVTAAPGEPRRVYIVEQAGVIRVLENGKLLPQPFLDMRSDVGSSGNEQGLLGLAFDPRYATTHRLYVDDTDLDGNTNVVSFRAGKDGVIAATRRDLLHVKQPYANHNGGMLAFGPNGSLYVGMGDGGAAGDPGNRAQNPDELLGKLLVLDPLGQRAPQLAALGLRNPWRFSFDRGTGDLYIGDVGQGSIEEIDYVRAGTKGLLNFGWHVYEGTTTFQSGQLGPGRLTGPIAQYSHDLGCSVTGGYVYRGKAVQAAAGRYFYGDYCSGTVWSLTVRNGRASRVRREPFTVQGLSSFGEDSAGELYLVSLEGVVYRLAA